MPHRTAGCSRQSVHEQSVCGESLTSQILSGEICERRGFSRKDRKLRGVQHLLWMSLFVLQLLEQSSHANVFQIPDSCLTRLTSAYSSCF